MFTEGLPTAANSAGQSAASILRATLTTTSANCGVNGRRSGAGVTVWSCGVTALDS